MNQGVWIIGAYQSDFGRNLSREGRDFADLTAEVTEATLSSAGLSGAEVDVVHVGNAFGELFAGQGHLGAMPATVDPALWGLPASRHEAACASGSVATRGAIADLAAGFHQVALVLGLELERTVPSDVGAAHLGAAAWAGHEGADTKNIWASVFSQVADEYERRYGLDHAHLQAIATTNLGNARRNPNAQTRTWTVPDLTEAADDTVNPIVEGRLRRYDCSQLTDGAPASSWSATSTCETIPGCVHWPASKGGDTAPSGSACARNSSATTNLPTSCRMCGRPLRRHSTAPE